MFVSRPSRWRDAPGGGAREQTVRACQPRDRPGRTFFTALRGVAIAPRQAGQQPGSRSDRRFALGRCRRASGDADEAWPRAGGRRIPPARSDRPAGPRPGRRTCRRGSLEYCTVRTADHGRSLGESMVGRPSLAQPLAAGIFWPGPARVVRRSGNVRRLQADASLTTSANGGQRGLGARPSLRRDRA